MYTYTGSGTYIEKRALFPQRDWKKWAHAIGEGVGRAKEQKERKRKKKTENTLEGNEEKSDSMIEPDLPS